MVLTPPARRVRWQPCWRLVPSRFPPQGLFDRVADPADLDVVYAIEALTNDRLRQEAGDLSLVPPAQRVSGPGTTPIMAAFTHRNPDGSRFTAGDYGIYYAAKTIGTAIAETRYHRVRFLAATAEAPIEIDMRSYASDVDAMLHDIRALRDELPEIYDPDPARYAPAQALGHALREAGSNGIAYRSVRDADGECVAIFNPTVLSPVRPGAHYCYVWDGEDITHVYRKELLQGPSSGAGAA